MSGCVKCGHDPDAVPTASWLLEIPYAVKSMNAHSVNAGTARFGYQRDRRVVTTALMVVRRSSRVPNAIARRRVTIARVMAHGQREFDRDNFHGGCKVVLDAMVREGLLVDDTAKWAQVFYEQMRGGTGITLSTTRILLEELA